MTTRSSTAPVGNFLPVSIVISLIGLVGLLFIVLQTASLPIFPATNSPSNGATRNPLFRGLIHIPEFRWAPLFPGALPDAAVDESHMPQDQLIDRWEPFIKEASARYSIPEKWIRTIIRIESGGRTMLLGRPITSGAGAMGVMQLMRDTYSEMSANNGLGSNPYDVHDNILAGTAYLRELYNRYGYPRLFAAYNAGPAAVEAHMHGKAKLPAETRNYVRLALAGTASAERATKLMAQFSESDPKAKAAQPKASSGKASGAKVTKAIAEKPAARPVHLAAHHSAAKPTRIATHVAPRTKHAAVTHSAHHRVKSA